MGPAHCPTRFSLYKKHQGRGTHNTTTCTIDTPHTANKPLGRSTHLMPSPPLSDSSGNVEERVFDYPLPTPPPSVAASGGFNYPNSNGFQFEAMALQVGTDPLGTTPSHPQTIGYTGYSC